MDITEPGLKQIISLWLNKEFGEIWKTNPTELMLLLVVVKAGRSGDQLRLGEL